MPWLGGLLLLVAPGARASIGGLNRTRSLRARGGALAELLEEFPAPPPAAAAGAGNVVTVDFLYGTECSNCLSFMRQGLIPLMESGLPGDRVKLTVLPFLRIEKNMPTPREAWDMTCRVTDQCFYALAPLCALRGNVPAALPVDSADLAQAMRFVECNEARRLQSHPDAAMDVTEEMRAAEEAESRACAAQVGLQYDGPGGIKECAEGTQALDLIHSPGYTNRMYAWEDLIDQSGQEMMPYLYMDGDVLLCDGSMTGVDCTATWNANGAQAFAQPGSLVHVVCSRLNPKPAVCEGVSAKPVQVGPTPFCENCAEAGALHWRPTEAPRQRSWRALYYASAGALVVTAGVLGLATWLRGRCELMRASATGTEPPLE